MIGAAAIGAGSGVGCALLAFWLVARHPGLGPQTLRGCFVGCLTALALLTALGPALDAVLAVSGRPVALLAVADPILVFAFWTGGLMIRAFLGGASAHTHR